MGIFDDFAGMCISLLLLSHYNLAKYQLIDQKAVCARSLSCFFFIPQQFLWSPLHAVREPLITIGSDLGGHMFCVQVNITYLLSKVAQVSTLLVMLLAVEWQPSSTKHTLAKAQYPLHSAIFTVFEIGHFRVSCASVSKRVNVRNLPYERVLHAVSFSCKSKSFS